MSLSPSYAPPNETSQEIWIEVSGFIGATVLGGVAFGILTTLYVLCLSVLLPQVKNRSERKWAFFHIVYCTLVYLLVGFGTGGNARLAQIYWINNRNYPGGPLAFIEQVTSFSLLVWGWTMYIVASWLQDAYVIYRCLIFWNWNYLICGLPILCFIGSMATSLALIVQIARPGDGVTSPLAIKFATSWYIFSVSINVIVTVAIVSRLLWRRRTIIALLGKEHSRVYTGVVSMLVESAAIYSIFGIIFIATYFRLDPVEKLVITTLGTLEGICPLMIIYRVASGRGWTDKTMEQMTSLRFAAPRSSKPTTSTAIATPGYPTPRPDSASDFDMDEMRGDNSVLKKERRVVIVEESG